MGKAREHLVGLSEAAEAARKPMSPGDLFDAQHDRVHRDRGRSRVARTVRRPTMRPMKSDDPAGTRVSVVMDDQTIVRTKTRSETWTVGGSHQVVLLEGRTGGYLVKRCSVIEPGDTDDGA